MKWTVRGLIRMNNICIDSLEIACGNIFSLSVCVCAPIAGKAFDEHILLLLYFICYSILFTCWAFVDEISTHRDRLTLCEAIRQQKQTDIKHTRVSIFYSCKSFSLRHTLSSAFSFSNFFPSPKSFPTICFCISACLLFAPSLGWYRFLCECVCVRSTIELMHVYATLFCVCIWAQSIGFPRVMP